MGEEEKIDLGEEEGKKGISLIMVIIIVLLSFGGGIAVYKFFLAPKPQPVETTDVKGQGDKTKGNQNVTKKTDAQNDTSATETMSEDGAELTKDSAETQKGVLSLNEFIVNLNDPIGRRYMKVMLKLELGKKEYEDKIRTNELMIPKIRDVIFLILSSKTFEELKTVSGKLSLKQEIIAKVNEVLNKEFGEDIITNCYFIDFVIQ
jgi:flagellar FliL protein